MYFYPAKEGVQVETDTVLNVAQWAGNANYEEAGEMCIRDRPCGVCRQVMMEFCDPETFQIILATGKEQYEVFTLKEILPLGFGPKNLR